MIKKFGIEDLLPWFIGLIVLSAAGLVGFIIYTEYQLHQPISGTVVETYMEPAHTTTTMVLSGKILVPVITRHPDRWYARIRDDKDEKIKVRAISKAACESLRIGEYVELHQKE